MKFLGCVGVIAVVILGSILNGVTLSILWGWFVVPTFNAPDLGVAIAIGLSIIVTYLTYTPTFKNDKGDSESDAIIKLVVLSIGKPLIYLAMGWVVTLFI